MEQLKKTRVVAAFPATGKSYLTEKFKGSDFIVLDSDSSQFSWVEKGVRNPNLPNNYIEHIKINIGKVDTIFVSSHKEVREALQQANINYFLVYPHESLIKEYITRFAKRGNDEKFIYFIAQNWYAFIDDMKKEKNCVNLQLLSNQYLEDAMLF